MDFSNLKVAVGEKVVKTCPAAVGFAFAAGTTDGPGAFDFKQGDDQASKNYQGGIVYLCMISSTGNIWHGYCGGGRTVSIYLA